MNLPARRPADLAPPPVEVLLPPVQRAPFVYASPHSGSHYPEDFLASSRLDRLTLRRSEDGYVHEIFGAAPALGAPLLHALFPRVCLDANREPYELDPEMFHDALPAYVNTTSLRVAGGIGTIARIVASGAEIYRGKLGFAEARRRVSSYYLPYHEALKRLIRETRATFGCAVLIDCHSMPSQAAVGEGKALRRRPDIVLGNRYGNACGAALVAVAREVLSGFGYDVILNTPYAGGYNVQKYGRPEAGLHALQIEINRDLYMDEERVERGPEFPRVCRQMTELMRAFGDLDPEELGPRP